MEIASGGERNIAPNACTNEGRGNHWVGHYRGPNKKVVQITSFTGTENENLTLTQNLVTRWFD